MKKSKRVITVCFGILLIVVPRIYTASACSGAVYFGKAGQTVTGRTMDWKEDMPIKIRVPSVDCCLNPICAGQIRHGGRSRYPDA